MRIYYTRKASKQLKSLPDSAQKRIAKKMRFYAKQKDPLDFAKSLVNHQEGSFRFRIGDYRLVFDVKDDKIYVLKIGKRSEIYE